MRSFETVLLVLAVTVIIGLFGVSWIVAPVAKIAILLVPAIFMVSLAIGFVSRRGSWFQ
jgi:hypothetical protein